MRKIRKKEVSTIKRFINYLKGVKSEFRKIRWSKGKEVVTDFGVIVAIVFILVIFFGLSDLIIVNVKDLIIK